MEGTDIDEVLEIIGFGPTQCLMVVATGWLLIYLVNETLGFGTLIVSISCDLAITDDQRSHLLSAVYLGMIISGHYAGYETDKRGRRKIMLYGLALSSTCAILTAAMPEFYSILVFRFLTGLCMTGATTNVLTYILEFIKTRHRPIVANSLSFFAASALIFVPVVAIWLAPLSAEMFSIGDFKFSRWRLALIINAIPAIISFIFYFILPESAKFYLSMGESQRAYDILNKICIKNKKSDLKSFGIVQLTSKQLSNLDDSNACCIVRMWRDTVPFFKRPYVCNFLMLTYMLAGFFLVGGGMTVWFMQLMQRTDDSGRTVCQMIESFESKESNQNQNCEEIVVDYSIGLHLGLAQLAGYILFAIELAFLSRRITIFSSCVISTLCGFSLNFFENMICIIAAYIIFLALSVCSTTQCASAIIDMVPTHMRGKAVALSYTIGRIGVFVGSILIGRFVQSHCLVIFNILVAVIAANCVFAWFAPL